MPKKMITIATSKMVSLYQSSIGRSIRRLQRRLAKKAIRVSKHRFDDLYNLMYNPKWVEASLKLVLANKGSRTAGSDGITKQHLKDEKNREAFIRNIIYELKNGLYESEPAKRVYIDKSSGGKRPLGIPTLKDRVVQQTLKLIIEPIFESDFLDGSIGFRPNRGCHDALPVFYNQIQSRKKFYWVIEGDISGCFDNISHRILIRLIKKRIKDKKLLSLIRNILKAGYIENGKVNKPGHGIPAIGTPQGANISPLLANIYLNEFDKWFDLNYGNGLTAYQKRQRRNEGHGNAILIRYADDFATLWNGRRRTKETFTVPPEKAVDAVTMKEQIRQFLRRELKLTLSEDKTSITHVNDGFNFLGFHIKRYTGGAKPVTLTSVPERKIRKFKEKIQRTTNRKGAEIESVAHKIMAINRIVKGWAEYYKYTNWIAFRIPTRIDYFINECMFRWVKRKHSKLSYNKAIAMYKHRQEGYLMNRKKISRWNFGLKVESTYVSDEMVLWLAKMTDRPAVRYRPKKKLNPFITYQYEMEERQNILEEWEGRGKSSNPYVSDEYWKNRRIALKRDKYRCQECGKRVKVGIDSHCHHIDGNSSNHDLDILVTLCMTCHYQTYAKEQGLTC